MKSTLNPEFGAIEATKKNPAYILVFGCKSLTLLILFFQVRHGHQRQQGASSTSRGLQPLSNTTSFECSSRLGNSFPPPCHHKQAGCSLCEEVLFLMAQSKRVQLSKSTFWIVPGGTTCSAQYVARPFTKSWSLHLSQGDALSPFQRLSVQSTWCRWASCLFLFPLPPLFCVCFVAGVELVRQLSPRARYRCVVSRPLSFYVLGEAKVEPQDRAK